MGRRAKGEGSVYQDKKGKWHAQIWVEADGVKKKKTFQAQTRADVVRKMREYADRIEKTGTEEQGTVEQEIREWLETEKKKELKPTSYMRLYSTAKNHIFPAIGDIPVIELKQSDIQRMLNGMAFNCLSVSSIKKAKDLMTAFLKDYLTKKGLADKYNNKAEYVKIKRDRGNSIGEDKYLDDDMCDRFIKECQTGKYKYGELLELLINTGLRIGEALSLEARDYDDQDRILTIRRTTTTTQEIDAISGETGKWVTEPQETTKTRAGARILSLNDRARTILYGRIFEEGLQGENLIFSNNGKAIPPTRINKEVNKVLAAIGWTGKKGCHLLRHSYASAMLRAGTVNIKELSELLGHRSSSITLDIYSHVNERLRRTTRTAVLKFDPTPEFFKK